jgi:hypothetical protein
MRGENSSASPLQKPLKNRPFFAHFSLHQSDVPLLWNRIENGRGGGRCFSSPASVVMSASRMASADLLHNSDQVPTAESEGEKWRIRE